MANFNAGNTTQGANSNAWNGITAAKITLSQSGSVQSLSVWWQNAGSDHFVMGIYSDNGSGTMPSALQATTAVATSHTAGLNTLATTTNPTLSPGTYWIAASGSVLGYYDNNASTLVAYLNGYANSGVDCPATWPGGAATGPYAFSMYGTFSTAGGSPQTVSPAGIASVTAFGTASVSGQNTVSPSGIASVTAFGAPSVSAQNTVSPAGIASVTVFGAASIIQPGLISPAGIASVTAFGAPTLQSQNTVSPSGIASTTAFGTPNVIPGGISPAGIASTLVFGAPSLIYPQSINPAGIPSSTVFGAPSILLPWLQPVGWEDGPVLVPPYCGQAQQSAIAVPATTAYREVPEESCWSMPPYAKIFPDVSNDQNPPAPPAPVPPPVSKTRLWDAQGVWPL